MKITKFLLKEATNHFIRRPSPPVKLFNSLHREIISDKLFIPKGTVVIFGFVYDNLTQELLLHTLQKLQKPNMFDFNSPNI
jgi:hypothetical protein